MEANLQFELNEWLAKDDVLWRQKYKELGLKDGDRNSKFFHLSTVICRKMNSINAIKSDQGVWITDKKEIRDLFLTKLFELFLEVEVNFPNNLEDLILPCISDSENVSLCQIPTPQEIWAALCDMPPLKALKLDGFPVLFYTKY